MLQASAQTAYIHMGTTIDMLNGVTVTWNGQGFADSIKWGYTTAYEKGKFLAASRAAVTLTGEWFYYNFGNGITPSATIYYQIKDKLYGMTSMGGADHVGVVFTIDTDGTGFADLYDFHDSIDGAYPHGSLVHGGSDLLYGMTGRGGLNDSGCVFTLDTNGGKFRDLLYFNLIKGANPFGSLIVAGTNLYGLTEYGGTNNIGVLFKIDTGYVFNTSIPDLTSGNTNIKVYPNPNNGAFTISNSRLTIDNGSIEVYNMLGEKVYSKLFIGQYPLSLDLSSQPAGVYLYRITSGNADLIGAGKLIIEK